MSKYIHTTLKGTLTAIMLMVGISAWAQNVAKIGETEYETVAGAISAASTSETTITIIANISENIAIPQSANITLDLNGHTLSTASQYYTLSNHGTLRVIDNSDGKTAVVQGSPYVFRNDGTATIDGGTYNAVGSANTVVIGSNSTTTITGGTFTSVENTVLINKPTIGATLSISGGTFSATDNAVVAGVGTDREGDPNTINISGGVFNGSITSDGYIACGIYNPWRDNYNISGGTFNVTGGCGILARAGIVNITGGTFNCTGTTTGKVGDSNNYVPCAAVVFDSKANYQGLQEDAKITISDGTFKSDASVASAQQITNDGDANRMEVTGGTFSTVDERFGNYLQSGYAVKATSAEPATYSIVAQAKTDVSGSIEGDAKTAADALAENTATTTTTGLAYDQSLEISIQNVTLEDGVVKTATFDVTPKDVNGNTIENASISSPITFRLPVSSSIHEGKWANLKHGEEAITGAAVQENGGNKFIEITTPSFSLFSYDIIDNPVAQISETKYESVNAAIADENTTTATITLLANDVTAINVAEGKSITLAIGTYTLSGAISNAGTLAISDGTISGNITNTGTLNISGGTFEGTITNNEGTISITGDTFTNEPTEDWIAEGYEVMVGNGKFIVATESSAEAKIVTVVDEVENTTLYQTIADAIVAASTNETTITLLKNVAAEEITIPEDANITLVVAEEVTLSKAITNAGTLTISDGTFTGTIINNGTLNITGGTFTNKPNSYTCEDGYDLVINAEGVYEVTDIASAEAQIDDNKYLTIDDAVTAAGTEETTVTLLKDLEGDERTITIPTGANITLVIANEVTLTKPISVDGTLAITSGTISETTLTITNFNAVLKITAGVTHPAVALSTTLQTENVLKSKAVGEPAVTTYWAEKRFEAAVALTGDPTSDQTTAATALASNTSIKEVTGIAENQSLTITVTSVEVTDSKVMKAAFEVKLIGADGQEVTGTVPSVTFRLPISDGLNGKWANLWHNTTAIPGINVSGASNGYVTVTTTTFSPFSYEIIETPIAQIGETKYASVADAITAAPSTETEIRLVGTASDVSENITVTSGKNVRLAIGTHTISGTVTNEGTLAIADGTISGAITNSNTLTITDGTFTGTILNTGTVAISGGTHTQLPVYEFCAAGYMPIKTTGGSSYTMTNSLAIGDNTDLTINPHLASGNYSVATATYHRNTGMVSAGNTDTKYGTICLPFSITGAVTGMQLYKATSISATELTITEITDFSPAIPAGTPLIFELSAVASSMTVTSSNAAVNTDTPTDPTDGNLLRGTYTAQNITDGLNNIYYLNGDHFHQAIASLSVPAFRAYIYSTGSATKPRTLSIVKASNQPTSIATTDALGTVTEVYDLNGRKQSGLQRGINIMRRADGSTIKVIVK